MDYGDSSDEEGETKVRVRFVTKIPAIRVTTTPIAVPVSLGRYGLSEVVNHLLGQADTPTPFDILINNIFLRSSLQAYMERHVVSGETVIDLEYLPALRQPTEEEQDEQPDWVSSIACLWGRCFVSGCYDGSLRVHNAACAVTESVVAHAQPINVVATSTTQPAGDGGPVLCVTGSQDKTARLWSLKAEGGSLEAVSTLVGHNNSVTAVAFWGDGSGTQALTADWDGHVSVWAGPGAEQRGKSSSSAKRRKGAAGEALKEEQEQQQAITSFKAHTQGVSGFAPAGDGKVYTASWDHSVKMWDMERQDTIHTVNTSKVVTCIASNTSSTGAAVATGHPDGRVRLWDTRAAALSAAKASLKSHKQWISAVQWVSDSETLLVSGSYDGSIKLWDARSSAIPLHTLAAHKDKALCLGWQDGRILSGGADGMIKTFKLLDSHS